jgi:pimeloyl-ACP methyl ester carboxylesterase
MARLAYEEAGRGPAVVLIHGHPFDRSMWRGQLAALSGRFRAIAPDLRGYGASAATPGTVTMAELAADVWELLDDIGAVGVAPVGLSMGGLVAIELAIARPGRVWALGMVASTAQPVTDEERRSREELADRVEAQGMEVLVETMAPRLVGPRAPADVARRVVAMMRAGNPAGAAAALRGRAQRPDHRAALRGLTVPVFVCTGTDDAYSTADVTAEVVDCLRSPTVVSLPGVGHMPNLEAPERFDAELLAFLERAAGM